MHVLFVKTETLKGSCDVIDSGILLGPSPELPVKYQCQFNIIARRDCRVLYWGEIPQTTKYVDHKKHYTQHVWFRSYIVIKCCSKIYTNHYMCFAKNCVNVGNIYCSLCMRHVCQIFIFYVQNSSSLAVKNSQCS